MVYAHRDDILAHKPLVLSGLIRERELFHRSTDAAELVRKLLVDSVESVNRCTVVCELVEHDAPALLQRLDGRLQVACFNCP